MMLRKDYESGRFTHYESGRFTHYEFEAGPFVIERHGEFSDVIFDHGYPIGIEDACIRSEWIVPDDVNFMIVLSTDKASGGVPVKHRCCDPVLDAFDSLDRRTRRSMLGRKLYWWVELILGE